MKWFREVWAGLRESHLELATLDLEKQKWWPEFEESWRCWERHSIKAVSLGKYISQQTTACRWCVLVTQACLTLRDKMDCSPPDSSVSRILWARTLQWVAIPFSRDLRDPGIKPRSPSLQADSLLSSHQRSPPAGCGQSEKCTYPSILLFSDFLLVTLLEELNEKLENMVTGWCYLQRLASMDPEKSVECVEMNANGKIKNIPSQWSKHCFRKIML